MDKRHIFKDLFDTELINKIKEEPQLARYIQEINDTKNDYINKDIPELPFHLFELYYTSGNRLRYETAYFERRKRLMTWGLSLWLDENEEGYIQLEDILWAICNEYSWALPAHTAIEDPITIDLFASETAFAIAEILHIHGHKLNKVVRERCISEVRRRVIYKYLYNTEKYNWEKEKNNWSAVCAGSIGIATIYLESDDIISQMLKKIEPRLSDFISSFEEDGTCLEGLVYWTYGVSFYVAFANILKDYQVGEEDLLKQDKFKKIALFQQKCHLVGNQTLSFSDGYSYDEYRLGLSTYLAHTISGVKIPESDNVSNYHSDSCYRWCHGIRDLIWTIKYKQEDSHNTFSQSQYSKEHQPSTYVQPYAQWLICNGVNSFAIKGGSNDEPHNHNDIGNFVYYNHGVNVLADLGAGEYVKDYFNENRYTIFCNQSFSHSVPIINGQGQLFGSDCKAVMREINESKISIDLESAYGLTYLNKLNRKAEFDFVRGIRLEDTYELSNNDVEVKERFISYIKPIINQDLVIFRNATIVSKIQLESKDIEVNIEIKEYKHSNHVGKIVLVYATDFIFRLSHGVTKIKFSIH